VSSPMIKKSSIGASQRIPDAGPLAEYMSMKQDPSEAGC
jgi:hypothetical protein